MEAAVKEKQETREPEPKRLRRTRVFLADHSRNYRFARVEVGTKLEDIIDPAYWAFIAPELQPWDRIEMGWDDFSQWCECIVLDCSKNWAKVYVLRSENLASSKLKAESEAAIAKIQAAHEVVHRGPRMWCVMRKSDKKPIKENCRVKEDAEEWLDKFAKGNREPG